MKKTNRTIEAKLSAVKNILEVSKKQKQNHKIDTPEKKQATTKISNDLRFTLRIPRKLEAKLKDKLCQSMTKISINQFILQCILKNI